MPRKANNPSPPLDIFGDGPKVDVFQNLGTVRPAGTIDIPIPTLRAEVRERKRKERYVSEVAEIKRIDRTWKRGTLLTLVTYRRFNIYRALIYWAEKYGPCELTASTWAMSEAAGVELRAPVTSGHITAVHLLVDFHTFQARSEGIGILIGAGATVGVTKQHAKAAVLTGGNRPLAIVTTANMCENQRIEVSILSDDPQDAAFHRGWMVEEIERTRTLIRPDGTLDGRRWRFNKADTLP